MILTLIKTYNKLEEIESKIDSIEKMLKKYMDYEYPGILDKE